MGKAIAVTSGKGGTGKSTVSVGLALAYAASQKRVLLIDMDEGLRCLDLMLGIDAQLIFDLSDALSGRDWLDSVYSVPDEPMLRLIPAPDKLGAIEHDAFGGFLREVLSKSTLIRFLDSFNTRGAVSWFLFMVLVSSLLSHSYGHRIRSSCKRELQDRGQR